jgi:serine/threonine protein kinase
MSKVYHHFSDFSDKLLALIKSGELLPYRPGLLSLQSSGEKAPTHLAVTREKIDFARKAFAQGIASNNELGLDFQNLIFNEWLSRHGKSFVAKYQYDDIPFVIKRTSSSQCSLAALQKISDRKISGSSWNLKAVIATPLAVRKVGEWVYELHTFYHGISLNRLVNRNRFRISGDYLGAMHNSLASALDRLHRDGLIHRDVRPENLFVLSDGSIVLLDCSFVCDEDSTQSPVDSGSYTAPEQLKGKAVARSDWYSLAATLYFTATGYPPTHPFDQATFEEINALNMGAFESSYFHSTECAENDVYSAACTWVAMLNTDLNRRPNNLSDVLLREHSRSAIIFFEKLISVLDMGNLGYLLLTNSGFKVITRSEFDVDIKKGKWMDDDILKDAIKKHREGKPNWIIGENA